MAPHLATSNSQSHLWKTSAPPSMPLSPILLTPMASLTLPSMALSVNRSPTSLACVPPPPLLSQGNSALHPRALSTSAMPISAPISATLLLRSACHPPTLKNPSGKGSCTRSARSRPEVCPPVFRGPMLLEMNGKRALALRRICCPTVCTMRS